MPITIRGIDRVKSKLADFFDGWDEELRDVGQVAANEIVAETLAGVGDGDQPFADYSDSYKKALDRAGGKGVVNLRGILPHTAPRSVRRPDRGLTDPDSEMSLDLITVTSAEGRVTISYKPRLNAYMIDHNDGTGRAPQRRWFTLNRQKVKEAVHNTMVSLLEGRIRRFNRPY